MRPPVRARLAGARRLRARRALAAMPALATLLACGDAAGPGARSSLVFAAVEDVAGELREIASDPTRRQFRCRYHVEPRVVGDRPVRLLGATVDLTGIVGDGPMTTTTTFSAQQVGSWFGGQEIPGGAQRAIWLESWMEVRADAELIGAVGAHQARWTFAYEGDSAVLTTRCLPATTTVTINLRDVATRLDVTGVELTLGSRLARTNEWGMAILHEVVLGRHRLSVRTGRHAPLDTTLVIPDPEQGPYLDFTLRRTAPGLHAFRFCPSMAYGGLCDPELELSDPERAARLPDSVRITGINTGTVPQYRHDVWSVRVETLDATRRRYTFPTINNLATRIRFEATNDLGARAPYECERPDTQSTGFVCRESP